MSKIKFPLPRPLLLGGLVVCALASQTQIAHAHFLWAQIDTETPASLHLSFAESATEMTNGVPLSRLNTAVAWELSGRKLTLAPDGTTLASALDPNSKVAVATQTYGVLDKSEAGRGVFLLEYAAKTASNANQAGHNAGLPLELFARPDGEQILMTVKHRGKPVPFNTLTVYTPNDEKGQELTTDAQGQLRFKASEEGLYGLRASVAEMTKGEFEGKKYDLVRRYTTLTFPVGHPKAEVAAPQATVQTVALAKPEAKGNPQADPTAYALLEAAHNARQVLPDDFPGYRAKVVFTDDDKTYTGTVVYDRKNTKDPIQLDVPGLDDDTKSWLEDTVSNQIGHRRGGSFAEGDGSNPITLGGSTNSFGTLVKLNDRMASEYRVKDNKVMEVTREAGDARFTISVIETMTADPGKYLANHFIVSYRSKKTGFLTQVDGFRDSYTQWNGVWLPSSRTVITTADKETARLRMIRYRNIEPLTP